MQENIALEEKYQKKFEKKFKKAKRTNKLSDNKVVKRKIKRSNHGTVYIGHIPHGFYENELKSYFEQFGKLKHVQLCRSHKTGHSKGYGFVEFADPEVAKIAAETMNNYLLFERRLEASLLPSEKAKRLRLRGAETWSPTDFPLKIKREKMNKLKNQKITNEKYFNKCQQIISNVKKTLKKLKGMGITYSFKAVDDSFNLNQTLENFDNSTKNVTLTKKNFKSSTELRDTNTKVSYKKSEKKVKASNIRKPKNSTNGIKAKVIQVRKIRVSLKRNKQALGKK